MIIFWVVCAAMALIALAFILPPLLERNEESNEAEVRDANIAVYRDQLRELDTDLNNGIMSKEQYDQDRNEIERRLLADVATDGGKVRPIKSVPASRNLAYLIAIALPVIAVVFYLYVGTRQALSATPPNTMAAPAESEAPFANQSGEMSPQRIAANVATLEKKLEQNPNDLQGWIMLARSYTQMQRYKDAAAAYEHATALDGTNADLWADYAYAVAMVNGKEMRGKPTEFINKALAIDPQNRSALMLAGNAAFEIKNYDQAIQYWERLLKSLPQDSAEVTDPLKERIAEAKRLAKGTPSK
jgi:cytochrome c-type biogenesis protein CcmH